MTASCLCMDILWKLLITLPFCLTIWFVHIYLQPFKKLPPGPWGLPFFGYSIFLSNKPHVTIINLKKKYGDIYSLNIGTETLVVLSSYKVIKEAFEHQSDCFSFKSKLKKIKSILSTKKLDEIYSQTNCFSSSILSDPNFQKSVMEPQISSEIKYLMKTLDSQEDSQALFDTFQANIINSLCTILTGEHFENNDETLKNIICLLDKMSIDINLPTWKTVVLNYIQKVKGTCESRNYAAELKELIADMVDTCDKANSSRQDSFINRWLNEVEKQGMNVGDFLNSKLKILVMHLAHNKAVLINVIQILFVRVNNTTSNILSWSCLYMIKYPEIKRKIQEEIDKIIGRDRLPIIDDLKSMPYTEATILEVMRIHSGLPLNVSCFTSENTVLNGHFLSEEINILPNIWAIHHDPVIFSDPNSFKPERFLNNQQEVKMINEFIPFSLGKFKLVEEPLVMIHLFLYFTSLLQTYNLKLPESNLNFDFDCDLIFSPRTYKICAVKR